MSYWDKAGWYLAIPEDERADFEKALKSAPRVIDQLLKIVLNLRREAELTSKPDYESAGWPYAAADSLGFRRACDKIITLLT